MNQFLGGVPQEDLQRILALGTADERAQRLRQQQAYGQMLRSRSAGSFTNPYAAALGGVADLTNSLFGAYQQRQATEGLEALGQESTRGREALLNAYMGAQRRGQVTSPDVIAPSIGMPDAAPEQVAMADALRQTQQRDAERGVREGTAYLGLLSGDRQLQQFGNALLRPDTGGLQKMRLEQGAERLRLMSEGDKRRADMAERKLTLLEEQARARKENAEVKAAEKKTATELKLEGDLRKEVMGNPVTRSYLEAQVAFDKVQRAAKDPSAAGDLALIFGVMKTLDPGSTVREGEFANAQNAGGVDDRVVSLYNRVIAGQRLSPEQRADFVRTAGTQFGAQQAAFQRLLDAYRGVAQRAGANISDVLPLAAGVSPETGAPTAGPARTAPTGGNIDLATPPATLVLPDGRRARRNPDGTYTTE